MKLIAGVDEAGRGALAGPVVAAAVILPDKYDLVGLNDSKKVSPFKREKLFGEINNQAISIGVGIVSHREIDKINILESTFKAMKMSLGKLKPFPDEALIDGFPLKTQIIPNRGIVKGDEKIDVIKAASIIAKVTRDTIMLEYDVEYPMYAFKNHKGYGTKEHIELLHLHKPCNIHRKTFKPVSGII